MKKHIIFLSLFMTGTSAISQVGIYTELPNATLDVAAKPTELTKADGIIAPKLKGSELKAKDNLYNTPQTGAIIYISEPLAAAETSAKTTNVTSIGYFFFNGNIWQKMEGSTGPEPWNVAGTTTPASINSQDIYQMGKVSVGKNSGQSSLDISGSFRSGNFHSGSVGTYSSILGGNTNQATAVNSIILGGVGNIASASNAVAGGNNSQSSGYAAFSFGSDVVAGASKQFTVGYFNAFTDGAANNDVLTDALFQVGNGGGPINRRNAFTILKNGNISIGGHSVKPAISLEINGTDGIKVPTGTSAQRPVTPAFGTLRYNSTIGCGEMYVNDVNGDGTQGDTGWRPL